jgi:hypothetical protein
MSFRSTSGRYHNHYYNYKKTSHSFHNYTVGVNASTRKVLAAASINGSADALMPSFKGCVFPNV